MVAPFTGLYFFRARKSFVGLDSCTPMISTNRFATYYSCNGMYLVYSPNALTFFFAVWNRDLLLQARSEYEYGAKTHINGNWIGWILWVLLWKTRTRRAFDWLCLF